MADFKTAMKTIAVNEGVYRDVPWDLGGPTKYGISQKQYPHLDIKNLTKQESDDIYYADYWVGRGAQGVINQKMATFALDTVIQHGQGPAILQRAANRSGANLNVDNSLGPLSWDAINNISPNVFLKNGVDERLEYAEEMFRIGRIGIKDIEGIRTRIKRFFFSPMKMTLGIVGILAIAGGLFLWMRNQ